MTTLLDQLKEDLDSLLLTVHHCGNDVDLIREEIGRRIQLISYTIDDIKKEST